MDVPGQKKDEDIACIARRAGYEDQKRQIEDIILLALLHPEVYEDIARATRARPAESVRPRAVLFEGPPGCGKTTSARRAACTLPPGALAVPLPHVWDSPCCLMCGTFDS